MLNVDEASCKSDKLYLCTVRALLLPAGTILFAVFYCGQYSREGTIQERVLLGKFIVNPLIQLKKTAKKCTFQVENTRIPLIAGTIQERVLLKPAPLQVRVQFESGHNSRAGSNHASTVRRQIVRIVRVGGNSILIKNIFMILESDSHEFQL